MCVSPLFCMMESDRGMLLGSLAGIAVGILVVPVAVMAIVTVMTVVLVAVIIVVVTVSLGTPIVVLVLVFDLIADHLDERDAMVVGLGDGDIQILKAEAVAAGGDLIQDLHDPAVDGDGVGLDLQVEELTEVGQAAATVDAEGVLGDLLVVLDHLVVLVPDVAYQLLQDVLHGDDTQSTAVLVQHHGQVGLVGLEVAEQVVNALALMDEQGRGDQLLQGLVGEALGGEDVLGMEDAYDLVDAVLVDQQAGEAGLLKELTDLLHGGADLKALQIHAVGQDILGLLLGEVDGVAEQVALLVVDGAFLLYLLHQHEQLLLGHLVVGLDTEDLGHQLGPQGEEEAEGNEDPDEELHEGRREHGKALGAVLGDGLGGDLTEDQHDDRDGGGGDQGAVVVGEGLILGVHAQGDDEHRGDGGQQDVDQIVADQDGGDQAVVVLAELEGEGSTLVALVDHGLELGLAQGRKGGLGGGKVSGHQEAHGHDDDLCLGAHIVLLQFKFTKISDIRGKNERKKAYLSRRVNPEQSRHATRSRMGAYTSKDIPL